MPASPPALAPRGGGSRLLAPPAAARRSPRSPDSPAGPRREVEGGRRSEGNFSAARQAAAAAERRGARPGSSPARPPAPSEARAEPTGRSPTCPAGRGARLPAPPLPPGARPPGAPARLRRAAGPAPVSRVREEEPPRETLHRNLNPGGTEDTSPLGASPSPELHPHPHTPREPRTQIILGGPARKPVSWVLRGGEGGRPRTPRTVEISHFTEA